MNLNSNFKYYKKIFFVDFNIILIFNLKSQKNDSIDILKFRKNYLEKIEFLNKYFFQIKKIILRISMTFIFQIK